LLLSAALPVAARSVTLAFAPLSAAIAFVAPSALRLLGPRATLLVPFDRHREAREALGNHLGDRVLVDQVLFLSHLEDDGEAVESADHALESDAADERHFHGHGFFARLIEVTVLKVHTATGHEQGPSSVCIRTYPPPWALKPCNRLWDDEDQRG
jgi:hypothetical protein